ncbi:MAG TPA: TIGR01777 family oxidoreductase [Nocardioidaceae bacterium]|jgi:uncharacterized protein (TIGR01777 family)
MRFLLAGASGFLGTALRDRLAREGHEVARLVRGEPVTAQESGWDPYAGRLDRDVVEHADVVVNVAGSPLGGNPHSAKYHRTLRESRVRTTATLADAIARSDRKPAFLAQNGTSYYGDRGDEVLTEDSGTAPGSFLTDLTRDWQAATDPAADAGARVCILRSAPVMDSRALAFSLIRKAFLTGLAGPLGNGRQYFPVIALEDWVDAVLFLAHSESSSGPYNLSAPEPCTNAEFTEALGRRLHRPTRLRVPEVLIRKAAGDMAGELVGSCRVVPARLLKEGFVFRHPDLQSILDAALG